MLGAERNLPFAARWNRLLPLSALVLLRTSFDVGAMTGMPLQGHRERDSNAVGKAGGCGHRLERLISWTPASGSAPAEVVKSSGRHLQHHVLRVDFQAEQLLDLVEIAEVFCDVLELCWHEYEPVARIVPCDFVGWAKVTVRLPA